MRKSAEAWAKSRKIEERLIAAVESMKAAQMVQESSLVGIGGRERGSARKERNREGERGGGGVRYLSGGARRKSRKSSGGAWN